MLATIPHVFVTSLPYFLDSGGQAPQGSSFMVEGTPIQPGNLNPAGYELCVTAGRREKLLKLVWFILRGHQGTGQANLG